jgi:hypothetical protein
LPGIFIIFIALHHHNPSCSFHLLVTVSAKKTNPPEKKSKQPRRETKISIFLNPFFVCCISAFASKQNKQTKQPDGLEKERLCGPQITPGGQVDSIIEIYGLYNVLDGR